MGGVDEIHHSSMTQVAREYVVRMSSKWTAADVPDQSGRVAIVTGANTGIGYDTAAVLAGKGAHVVLAVRNLDKGNDAADRIKEASPNADVTLQATRPDVAGRRPQGGRRTARRPTRASTC